MTVGLLSIVSPYAKSNGGYQLNTSTVSYFTGNNPFFNTWVSGDPIILSSSLNGTLNGAAAWNATGTGGASYFNTNTGELNNPCPADVTSIGRLIFTSPPGSSKIALSGNPWWYGQTINISWLGTSVPSITGSFSTLNFSSGNTATITLGNSLSAYNLVLSFSVPNVNDPPRAIVVSFASETKFGSTPFTQNYVNLIKQFATLRTMKWNGGGQNYQSDISQLADVNYNTLARNFSSTAMNAAWPGTVPTIGANGDFGPKGGLHPSIIVALANATGVNPWYCVPVAMSNSGMTAIATYFAANLNPNLVVTFEYGNEVGWNFAAAGPTAYVNAQVYPGTGTTGQPNLYSGYRAAQLWQIAHDTFGQRSRWRGTISGQQVNQTVAQTVIQGAQYYVANVAPGGTLLTDLFDDVITANYFGGNTSSVTITGASAVGATTTLTTSSNPVTPGFSTGKVVRLFFSVTTAGTLGALLNNVDVTLSATTSGSISFTNFGGNSGSGAVSTTGLTYSAGTNYLADGLLFDLMDTSLSNFNSTPATYPTKYSYFATQQWKAIITGAADNGYAGQAGTIATSAQQTNSLVAYSYGLTYRFYEGGLSDLTQTGDTNLIANSQFSDYADNYKFDTGVVGSIYTQAAIMAANDTSATSASFGQYPSQFQEIGGSPGPWTTLRSIPGDTGNPLWQAIVAQNALGPWVDPTLPATGTYASLLGTTGNYTTANSLTQTVPLTIGTVPANSLLVLTFESQNSTPPTAISIGALGSINVATPDAGSGTNLIYSFPLPTSAGNPTVTVTWGTGAAFSGRCVTAYLLTGLTSTGVGQTGTGTQVATVNVTKGAAVIASGKWSPTVGSITGGYPTSGGSGVGLLSPVSQTSGTNYGASALFNFPFSSQVMTIFAPSASLVVATYR